MALVVPASSPAALVHVTRWATMAHCQPLPLAADGTSALGKVSITVTGPLAGSGPWLFTVTVTAFVDAGVKAPVWVRATARSATGARTATATVARPQPLSSSQTVTTTL